MISPLLASGDRVRQGPAVLMAIVWNYFSRLFYMAGNRPAILCMGSTEVFPVLR